jgi:hypothetical protein
MPTDRFEAGLIEVSPGHCDGRSTQEPDQLRAGSVGSALCHERWL